MFLGPFGSLISFFVSEERKFLNFKKEKEFFLSVHLFHPISRKKRCLSAISRRKNAFFCNFTKNTRVFFFHESAKNHVSFWFPSCFVLTFRPMQFQVHSMYFLLIYKILFCAPSNASSICKSIAFGNIDIISAYSKLETAAQKQKKNCKIKFICNIYLLKFFRLRSKWRGFEFSK